MAYTSKDAPKSAILNSTFLSRLTSIFGYRASDSKDTEFERRYGMKFVTVDLSNDAYRIKNAAVGSVYKNTKLTSNLEKYFDSYLNDNMVSYADVRERQARLNILKDMYYNEVYISRVVNLVADEATQLDVQNRIISVESPNLAFTQRCYELFSSWGLTQQRIHSTCRNIELFGEAFWFNKVTPKNGISKIRPVDPADIMERLEFDPEKMAKYLAEKEGYMAAAQNRSGKLARLLQLIKSQDGMDVSENFADMYDSKLFGYELQDGQVVPPWCITHFRFDADGSEFFPYGRPPLLNCVTPWKMFASTSALQGLARMMSFPITLYKVKVTEGTPPARAFDIVNEVHEEYDNIGVTPSSAGSEVYTVNTKIWMPDGLLEVDTKEQKIDIGSTDDLELYMKRVAIGAGVPRGYIDPESDSMFGQSGVSLMEQYKPFARHVSEIQSCFLDELGAMIRLHFAITGEFDYNTPFILSMRFPAAEMGEDQRNARTASIDLSNNIMDLLKNSLGVSDEESLPIDVVKDVLQKYTFLDPTDIQKWMTSTMTQVAVGGGGDDEGDGGGDDDLFGDMGGGDDLGDMGDMGDMGGDADMGGEMGESTQPRKALLKKKKLYQEHNRYISRMTEARLKQLRERYRESRESIYFRFLESNGFSEWHAGFDHSKFVPKITENSKFYESILAWTENSLSSGSINVPNPYAKLMETSISEMLEKKKDEIAEQGNEVITRALEREIGLTTE